MKLTRQTQMQRTRIMNHCFEHSRSVMDEHQLILENKSDLSRCDRRYLVSEVKKAKEKEERLQENRNRKINNLK